MTTNVNLGFVAAAGGTVNAITATYSPAPTALVDKMLLWFRATGANTSTAPTFSPNGLTARTIVKQGGTALVAGDIPAANAIMEVVYDATNTRWELLNPVGSSNIIRATKINVTSAQVLQLNSTPVELIAAPGAGKAIFLVSAAASMTFNSIAYSANGTLQIRTDTATAAQMTWGGNGFLFSSVTTASRGTYAINSSTTGTQVISNKALNLSVDTGNPANGNSDISIYLTYQIIDL